MSNKDLDLLDRATGGVAGGGVLHDLKTVRPTNRLILSEPKLT